MLDKKTIQAAVSNAIARTPRKNFVTSEFDSLVVGYSIPSERNAFQILSQASFSPESRVLQLGTGAGYMAALIGRLTTKVTTVEKVAGLAKLAELNFRKLKLNHIELVIGDGNLGLPSKAPFDLIIASSPQIKASQSLLQQLGSQGELLVLEDGFESETLLVKYTRQAEHNFDRQVLGTINISGQSGDILLEQGLIDSQTLRKAKFLAQKHKTPLVEELTKLIQLEDSEIYESLAKQHNLELEKIDDLLQEADREVFGKFSRAFLDHHRFIPLSDKNQLLRVATTDPEASTKDLASLYPKHRIEKVLVTPTSYHRLWSSLSLGNSTSQFELHPIESVKEVNLLEEGRTEIHAHLILVFEAILLDAIGENASDIHLEVYSGRVRLRIRVDGELRDLKHYRLTLSEAIGLVNVIKTRCELDISEHRLPQGGRARLKAGDSSYDLRVQVQPSLHGEHLVIRMLKQDSESIRIDGIGFSERVVKKYQRLLYEPAGLVLVVGPTGSGKSTTLCAGLQLLAEDETRKVITIEDPIEYALENIQQTRVRSEIGFNFADAMRSFVRQDPDVILVGEIRDQETALEALRASQTGHLVLSTLHSNDATDAMQRLLDLQVDPNSIACELVAVIAQRLAKRNCPHCNEQVTPDPELFKELFPSNAPANFRCFQGKGCKFCGQRGTKGRVAVVEFLQVNNAIRNAISKRLPVNHFRSIALDEGMLTMRDSALDHIINGVIPMSELPRILPAERFAPEKRGFPYD